MRNRLNQQGERSAISIAAIGTESPSPTVILSVAKDLVEATKPSAKIGIVA